MKKIFVLALVAVSALFAGQVSAAEWGYLSTIPNDHPGENVFRVNIEEIDGKQPGPGLNAAVEPGTHEVKVSLVFNADWGVSMGMTEEHIYYDTLSVDVAAKTTSFLGAKVNTNATGEEQSSGNFWEPLVYSVE